MVQPAQPIDPRPAAVALRLAEISRVVAVTGGKGGIGKSVTASALALALARQGRAVGLLDLDLTSPCDHLILGVEAGGFPCEEHGIVPAQVAGGVRFMSVACFMADQPAPLRGQETTDALLEILAITRWGPLDVLVIDMPPGLGDAALDVARLMRRAEHLVVATPSMVVVETVRRMLDLLARLRVPVAGVVENMARGQDGPVAALAAQAGQPLLGTLPWDPTLEDALGHPERLLETAWGHALTEVARALGEPRSP